MLQGPGENAGIIDIGDGFAVAFKIESHNHPSFIEPFQGAATGVGGILRDIFTMGARPIAVMDALRFGPLDDAPQGTQPAARGRGRRASRTTATASACRRWAARSLFEPCYNGNPLVNVFCLGIVQGTRDSSSARRGRRQPGDLRGREDRPRRHSRRVDGVGGVHRGVRAEAPNVQVGDPFMEKLLLEACLEAMQTGAHRRAFRTWARPG